jgi:hypothetical protein
LEELIDSEEIVGDEVSVKLEAGTVVSNGLENDDAGGIDGDAIVVVVVVVLVAGLILLFTFEEEEEGRFVCDAEFVDFVFLLL